MDGSQADREYNLDYFTEYVTFADSESFRDSDKNRFFQFYPQDSLTTVAISTVQLTGTKKDKTHKLQHNTTVTTPAINVITRSNRKDGHAEKQTVNKIRQIIKELEDSGTKLETLTLVMNITYSPCSDADNNCQHVLQQFFETLLPCKITFVLRFAYLYHEKGVKGDDKPIEQLANWMIALEGVRHTIRVESIEVTKELSSYSHRDKEKWEKVKKKREEEDKAMKDIVIQVYKRKGEIEEENRKRAEAAAASLGKLRI